MVIHCEPIVGVEAGKCVLNAGAGPGGSRTRLGPSTFGTAV